MKQPNPVPHKTSTHPLHHQLAGAAITGSPSNQAEWWDDTLLPWAAALACTDNSPLHGLDAPNCVPTGGVRNFLASDPDGSVHHYVWHAALREPFPWKLAPARLLHNDRN